MGIFEYILFFIGFISAMLNLILLQQITKMKDMDINLRKQIERLSSGNDMKIPQPKFQIGDMVRDVWNKKTFRIQNCSYSVVMRHWYYYDGEKSRNSNHREENLYIASELDENTKRSKTLKVERADSSTKR